MNRLDNFVFSNICEISLRLHDEQGVYKVDYITFCNMIKTAIETNRVTKWQASFIFKLNIYLNKLYGFDRTKSAEYIGRYFIDGKYFVFSETTQLLMHYFRHSYIFHNKTENKKQKNVIKNYR